MRNRSPTPPAARRRSAPPLELREACVLAARDAIAEHGVENLSLRDVARRLGVSHQAPYKHYPSRDHLLAEVVRRCFESFAAHLDARAPHADPREELGALGQQYLQYAAANPLEYRLMFATPWPAVADDPALVRSAAHTFDILRQVMRRVHGDAAALREQVELDALFIWSSMHGLAGVMNGNCIEHLGLRMAVRRRATAHIMARVGQGLDDAPP